MSTVVHRSEWFRTKPSSSITATEKTTLRDLLRRETDQYRGRTNEIRVCSYLVTRYLAECCTTRVEHGRRWAATRSENRINPDDRYFIKCIYKKKNVCRTLRRYFDRTDTTMMVDARALTHCHDATAIILLSHARALTRTYKLAHAHTTINTVVMRAHSTNRAIRRIIIIITIIIIVVVWTFVTDERVEGGVREFRELPTTMAKR